MRLITSVIDTMSLNNVRTNEEREIEIHFMYDVAVTADRMQQT